MSDDKKKNSVKSEKTKAKKSSITSSKSAKSKKNSKTKSAENAKESSEVFILPAIVDITTVSSLHRDLSKVVNAKKKKIILDSAVVEKITTPAVQVILALFKTLEENKVQYSVENMSENFKQCLEDIGFGKKIEEWVK